MIKLADKVYSKYPETMMYFSRWISYCVKRASGNYPEIEGLSYRRYLEIYVWPRSSPIGSL